jgi:hypothetical protein
MAWKRNFRCSQRAAPISSDKAACFGDARSVEATAAQQILTPRLSGIEIDCTSRTRPVVQRENRKP